MAVDVKKLIAAINPDIYCDPEVKSEVKKLVKSEGYLKAAEKAKLKSSDYIDIDHIRMSKGAFALEGRKQPIEQHKLVYDAHSQTLEPIYFWILDYVNKEFDGGVDKLIDNFLSSPGSGHFAEMQSRATRMQEEGMKILQTAGILVKSIIQIIYDLKEFKMRLAIYDESKSKDEKIKSAALLSLKQIWMDNVDIKRGAGSINGLAQQLGFATIRDAFMSADSLEDVKKIDLNERVKRILLQRVSEFKRWIKESEKELRKRFKIETLHLKNQVSSVKLYARWAKPYLKAATQLEQRATATADLVTAFNTSIFELTLLAKGKYKPKDDVDKGDLPKSFEKAKLREYFPLALIEFVFRSVPDRTQQQGGYAFRGKIEVTFTSFALNEDELIILKEKIEEDDFGDVYEMITGATEKSLEELEEDLDEFLEDSPKEKEEESEDINPFSALFSGFKREKKKEKDLSKGIPKDSEYEKVIRSQTILEAREKCRKLYDTYKKVHEMPVFPTNIS